MKKALFFVAAFVALVTLGCSNNTQKVSLDIRFNALAEDSTNYFKWSEGGNAAVADGYDAATGASKAQSTTRFDAVRYDNETSKKAAIPSGLRSLVLFPIASFDTAVNDAFTVTENGKQLTIRFVHRGTAYQILTDSNGKIDIATSFSTAAGVADNIAGKFLLKDEYLVAGGSKNDMNALDWTKITLTADTAAADATRSFEGTLDASYKNGILTVKGSLTQKQ